MAILTKIRFRRVDMDSLGVVMPLLARCGSRSCDFTAAGLLMWADYFRYEYAVVEDTLFIRGMEENDLRKSAFSLPVGSLPPERSLDMIREYCADQGEPLTLSAVPEDLLEPLLRIGTPKLEELEGWADYLYRAESLATLEGSRYGKKRNHVHRFMTDYPDYRFEPLGPDNIESVREYFDRTHVAVDDNYLTATAEAQQVREVLRHYDRLPFEGGVLSVPERGVVAFTIGEVRNDTLWVHVEKMDHGVSGAGESVNKLFAEDMLRRHPELRWINREEDVGDPGLRRAKESYHPDMMLRKYNVTWLDDDCF